jgi:transposase-like protein
MNNATKAPATLLEAIQHFADPDASLDFVVGLRWPDGIACPHCEAKEPSYLKTRRIWKCRECRKQFSVKVGTIFEDSPIGLDKWLPALWMLANCKNEISSYELARGLGVTQKTGWFMLHRIRLAMQTKSFKKWGGVVEADETYMGGKAANMHPRRKKIVQKHPLKSKVAVIGLLKRGPKGKSIVRATVRENVKRETLHAIVQANVKTGAVLFTDAHPSYRGLTEYQHAVVDHSITYVKEQVHTNGLENFWSLLKRTVRGTYVSVDPGHLSKYVDEQVFRYNSRKGTDHTRFVDVVSSIFGRRLTYQALVLGGELQSQGAQ